jgi:hypothetical protein
MSARGKYSAAFGLRRPALLSSHVMIAGTVSRTAATCGTSRIYIARRVWQRLVAAVANCAASTSGKFIVAGMQRMLKRSTSSSA